MKNSNKFLSALLGVAFVGMVFTSCESEKSPTTDKTKLWPAFKYDKEDGERKYGYINSKGEWAIQPIYNEVSTFSDGVAPVATYNEEKDEYVYYYIDKKGNSVGSFAFADQHYCGLAVASYDDDMYGFVDASATFKISPMYEDVYAFSDDLAKYYDETADDYGFLNKKGESEIPAIKLAMYDGVSSFSEGLARVYMDEKYGFINKKAELEILALYDWASSFSDGLAIYRMGERYGFIDKKGDQKIIAQYDDADVFFEDGLAPVEQNGRWGFINKKGEMKIQPMFEYAYPFCEGMALVLMKDKCGFINTKGDIVIPAIYDSANEFFHNGLVFVYKEDETSETYMYINKKGETIWQEVIEYDYEEEEDDYYSISKLKAKEERKGEKPNNHYTLGGKR
ncbi:MAG: WG repeat-containing protein [Paludibacteraceae bacterium]|nr:WG repeat-containing protein [Paludibacteraceae bacterium]